MIFCLDRPRRGLGALGGVLVILLAASPAHASREDGAPAAALGLADSVKASAVGASAIYFNPAGMSGARQFAVEAGYSFLDGMSGHSFGVAAVDSATNGSVAMGIGYSFITSAPDGVDRDGHNVRGALSTGYRGDSWSLFVGVGARYLTLTQSTSDVEFFTVDAGLILTVGTVLRIGVTGQNLIDTKSIAEGPRKIGVGAAVNFDSLQLSVDADFDLMSKTDEVTNSFSFGAQYLIQNMIVARVGFAIDGLTERNRFAVGLAYVSERIGADIAYSRTTADPGETIVSAAFKVFLP